ncbi:MAG: histidine triad nucleotide-binding protein [Ruminococcaceae bacterium]|nr:histidine triad nucleotide-binding protein [Oscillospiraceae bacterium]
MDCLFCAIIEGKIPSTKVYEDDCVLAFKDINPNAPVHVLVVPKTHIESVDCVNEDNVDFVAKVMLAIPKVAKVCGLENGYRVITNVGEDGGQTVKHIHFHILGGEKLPVKLA